MLIFFHLRAKQEKRVEKMHRDERARPPSLLLAAAKQAKKKALNKSVASRCVSLVLRLLFFFSGVRILRCDWLVVRSQEKKEGLLCLRSNHLLLSCVVLVGRIL